MKRLSELELFLGGAYIRNYTVDANGEGETLVYRRRQDLAMLQEVCQ